MKIASWNIEGRLSDITLKKRGSDNILKTIKDIDADILVLLEAHSEISFDNLASQKEKLKKMGYSINSVPYEDDMATRSDSIIKRSSLILLSKLPIQKFEIIRLANLRNALMATIGGFRIIGLHLDDRLELTRLNQMKDLVSIIGKSNAPTIVMGDFNAMHGTNLWPAGFLRNRPIRLMSKFIFPAISIKAVEMARGEALQLLQDSTNLIDADPRHQPTTTPKMRGREWLPSIRLIQIDHIFASKNIQIKNFQISVDGGADHRAIIADVDID